MKRAVRNRNLRTGILIVLLILVAELCRHQRHFGLGNEYNLILKPLRVVIYLSMFIAWGISIERRISNRQLRSYLRAITIMIIFWFSERTVRLFFVLHQGSISRILWYSSYIPVILIPTFMLFAAMHTRKDDEYRLPGWAWAVTGVSLMFSAVVITNDFHYKVFSPKGTIDMLESWYSYTWIYWLLVGWIVALIIISLGIISVRCRVPHSRRIALLPIVIMAAAAVYFLFMMTYPRSWKWLFGDYTPFICISIIGILESCIQSGMIPSNLGYDELFRSSPMGILITDDDGTVIFRSAQAADIPQEILSARENEPVQFGRDMLIRKYKLSTGYAVWEEDISELADTIETLETNRRELSEANYLSEHNYRTVSRLRHAQEQNRLYDRLRKQTASQNMKLQGYLNLYDEESDEEERRRLLADSAVIAAYIKRSGNLLFYSEKSSIVPTEELRMCMEESMQNIRLKDVECVLDINMPGGMNADTAMRIFDLYEGVVESVLDKVTLLYVKISSLGGTVRVRIECETACEADYEPAPEVIKTETGEDHLRVIAEFDDMRTGGRHDD